MSRHDCDHEALCGQTDEQKHDNHIRYLESCERQTSERDKAGAEAHRHVDVLSQHQDGTGKENCGKEPKIVLISRV